MSHIETAVWAVGAMTLVAWGCGGGTTSGISPNLEIAEEVDASGDDGAETSSDDAAVDVGPGAVDTAAPPSQPGLGINYDAFEPGISPRFEPNGEGWLATPWPSDRLRSAEGGLDLSTFPNDGIPLLTQYLEYGEEVLTGWGLNGCVYVNFEDDLDEATLPSAEVTMTDAKARVQLVNVTVDSDRFGEQVPLEFSFYREGSDDYYPANTLAMRPVFGFPLAESETYCAVVTRGLHDEDGRYLSQPPDFLYAFYTAPDLAPLNMWLSQSMLLLEDLAVATCFTAGTPTAELRTVREHLEESPLPPMTDIEYLGKVNNAQFPFHEFRGHYTAPNFQAGEKPYDTDGDLRFDDEGAPIVQFEEPIRFVLLIPTLFNMPAEGWPVALYAHGTGGDFETCKTQAYMPGPELAKEGFAMICIDQPLHGERQPAGVTSWDEQDITYYAFNVPNPRAGRTGFRQSAIDTMSLARMVSGAGFDLSGEDEEVPFDVHFDPENIYFFGHSHGGISGAMAMAVEPRLKAGVLSGAGGVLIETILRRTDPLPFAELVRTILDVDEAHFDTFHPTLTLIQMLVDATDPVNYAPYWLYPEGIGVPKHVFVTEGTADAATPSVGTDAMCAAAKIPIIDPVVQESLAHELLGLAPVKEPVVVNITLDDGVKRTAAVKQWAGGSHWVAFENVGARSRWKTFFKALRYGQDPVIAE